jgi:hypothetical protein
MIINNPKPTRFKTVKGPIINGIHASALAAIKIPNDDGSERKENFRIFPQI